MSYVDGLVFAVPTAEREKFRRYAEKTATAFLGYGALEVVECWGDDVPEGKLTSFPMAVQRKPDETVVLAWITWPSRAVRDAGIKRSMEDPDAQEFMKLAPFDGRRMIFGGFEVLVRVGQPG